jgi:Zn-dependent M16 (insulinase) family peptidase
MGKIDFFFKKVRNYHKSYYRPDNLCLIITGKVDKDELLKVLEPVEQSIISKGALPEMQRPWVSTGDFPNLKENLEETVLFADEDESMGTIYISWNGPMCHVSFFFEIKKYFIFVYKRVETIGLSCSKRIGCIE